MPRNLNGVTAAMLRDPTVIYFHFLKMIFPSPLGTLRWSTYDKGDASINLTVDGGAHDWDCTQVWIPGQFTNGIQSYLTIADVKFGNADRSWSTRLWNYGWRNIPVTCWLGFFDKITEKYKAAFVLFDGIGERAEVGVEPGYVNCSLLPGTAPFSQMFPRRRFLPSFGFNFLPAPNLKIQWGVTQASAPYASQPDDVSQWNLFDWAAHGLAPPASIDNGGLTNLGGPPPPKPTPGVLPPRPPTRKIVPRS